MTPATGHDPRLPIWTYGYALTSPIARARIGPLEVLLDDGHTEARRVSRTWEGRLIDEDEVTHILVVCDTSDRDLAINRALERELDRLGAPFLVTASVLVQGSSGPGSPPASEA